MLPVLILSTLPGLVACGPSTPEEEVAQIRRQYTVKFNTWMLQNPEPEPMEAAAEEAAMASEAAAVAEEAAAEGEAAEEEMDLDEELAEVDLGPLPSSILFDLLVRFDGEEPLPGITVEITHADPFEKEKEVRLHFIDTSSYGSGEKTRQESFVLDGFAFEDGDVFSVEFHEHVSPEERAGYREFALGPP